MAVTSYSPPESLPSQVLKRAHTFSVRQVVVPENRSALLRFHSQIALVTVFPSISQVNIVLDQRLARNHREGVANRAGMKHMHWAASALCLNAPQGQLKADTDTEQDGAFTAHPQQPVSDPWRSITCFSSPFLNALPDRSTTHLPRVSLRKPAQAEASRPPPVPLRGRTAVSKPFAPSLGPRGNRL